MRVVFCFSFRTWIGKLSNLVFPTLCGRGIAAFPRILDSVDVAVSLAFEFLNGLFDPVVPFCNQIGTPLVLLLELFSRLGCLGCQSSCGLKFRVDIPDTDLNFLSCLVGKRPNLFEISFRFGDLICLACRVVRGGQLCIFAGERIDLVGYLFVLQLSQGASALKTKQNRTRTRCTTGWLLGSW